MVSVLPAVSFVSRVAHHDHTTMKSVADGSDLEQAERPRGSHSAITISDLVVSAVLGLYVNSSIEHLVTNLK